MLAILVLTPGTRRFSFWISFKLVDLVDFGLHVRGGALHLNRDCVHQRFERSWIVREPGDEFARLRRSRNHNLPGEALDRQIGGIKDVAMRVDDTVVEALQVAPGLMLGTRLCRPPTRCRPRRIHADALFASFGCFQKLPGMTGLSWSIEAAKRHGKKTGYAYRYL